MSEIREILSNAQAAEARGEPGEASRLLREAASYYRDRQMLKRAAQMLRQARRVEGVEEHSDEIFGFGADFEGQVARPVVAPAPTPWQVNVPPFELPSQRRARMRFTRMRARLNLVIGPTGTGKSEWLRSLGAGDDFRHLEISQPLTVDAEDELLAWLQPGPRSAFLVVCAAVPRPALVLSGEFGDEPIYDTNALVDAIPQLSQKILSRVDAIHSFEAPSRDQLIELGAAIAQSRGIGISDEVLGHLVGLALQAQRGAHEMVSLITRIPPGTYRP